MTKTCAELFEGTGASILGNPDEVVEGLAYNSTDVKPKDAFFCIVGFKVDGHSFAQDAIDRGASVIVAERRLYLADSSDVTVVIVGDTRRAMAQAACAFYDNPSESFSLVGVTGTNGKTTTTYLIESIARAAGLKCGIIGTVGVKIGDEKVESDHTTPESVDLQRTFARMRDAGCQVVAMEVSSHALDLERVWGSRFAVTAFTNLTQDHLDYHHTFEAYFDAKARLFGPEYPAKRVVGIDTEWGRKLLSRCRESGDAVISTGFDPAADIHPDSVDYHSDGTHADLSVDGAPVSLDYKLVGRFNVENTMTALAAGLSLGVDEQVVLDALSAAPAVPGRLQQVGVDLGAPFAVYVDYAHTPDALVKALNSVGELGSGRTIVVFGCGGDRDREKRPIMGKAALAADVAIVTSDNPRSEDPDSIISEIVSGMREADSSDACAFEVISDRRSAIRRAVGLAKSDDVVLIAGKGHEDYQIVGSQKHHFDDCEEALAAMRDAMAGEMA